MAVNSNFARAFSSPAEAEMKVAKGLLADVEAGRTQEYDDLVVKANNGDDLGQIVIGAVARIEADDIATFERKDQQRREWNCVPNDTEFPLWITTVDDLERCWGQFDELTAAFLRIDGNHTSAERLV